MEIALNVSQDVLFLPFYLCLFVFLIFLSHFYDMALFRVSDELENICCMHDICPY